MSRRPSLGRRQKAILSLETLPAHTSWSSDLKGGALIDRDRGLGLFPSRNIRLQISNALLDPIEFAFNQLLLVSGHHALCDFD